MGRAGWFFLKNSIPEYRGLAPLWDRGRARWKEFSQKLAYLEGRGVHYLVLVVLNKEAIYPEYMPESITRIPPPALHRRFAAGAAARGLLASSRSAPGTAGGKEGGSALPTDRQPLEPTVSCGRFGCGHRGACELASGGPRREDVGSFRVVKGKSGDLARLMGIEDRLWESTPRPFHQNNGRDWPRSCRGCKWSLGTQRRARDRRRNTKP